MRKVLEWLLLLAVFFPYLRIVDIGSYNQPYGYIFALLLLTPRSFMRLPLYEQRSLLFMFIVGTLLFIYSFASSFSSQEVKYLLNYLGPILFVSVGYRVVSTRPAMVESVLRYSIVIWFLVALVQFFGLPNFGVSFIGGGSDVLGSNILRSGRGVLGLAPEPTHFAVHMILLAAVYSIVGARRWPIVLCLISVVVLAQSSSAVMALGLGGCAWAIMYNRKQAMRVIGFGILAVALFYGVQQFLPEESRLVRILTSFFELGFDILQYDYSVNLRFGGMVTAYEEVFRAFFLPHGLSHSSWLIESREIVLNKPWLIGLSEVGFPSGYGLVLYQIGFFALPLVCIFCYRVFCTGAGDARSFLAITVLFIFNFQFTIATPLFGICWACFILASRIPVRRRQDGK